MPGHSPTRLSRGSGSSGRQPDTLLFFNIGISPWVRYIPRGLLPVLGIVSRRDFSAVSAALPFVRTKFATRMAFAQTNVAGVLTDKLSRTRELQATTLAFIIFFNRGDHFDAVPCRQKRSSRLVRRLRGRHGRRRARRCLSEPEFFCDPSGNVPRLDAGRGLRAHVGRVH